MGVWSVLIAVSTTFYMYTVVVCFIYNFFRIRLGDDYTLTEI